MSEIKKINNGNRYCHASVGQLENFNGKAFCKEMTESTSCEISFGTLAPGQSVPFYHSHKENEENYIVLSGKGDFQADEDVFPIASGSIVRVSTGVSRNIKNTGDTLLAYICIQAKQGSLNQCTAGDAVITENKAM